MKTERAVKKDKIERDIGTSAQENRLMRVIGYARVSTKEQSLDLQLDSIKKYAKMRDWDLVRMYEDKASGKDTDRPGFKQMVSDLEENPLRAEAVIITKLDRIGRSLWDLINILKWLQSKKIGLVSIGNNIDTTTREGRLFFYIAGAFAEYEREIITERTEAGKVAAREAGVKFGRRVKEINVAEARRLIALDVPKTKVARSLGVSKGTLYARLAEDDRKAASKKEVI